MTRLGGWVVRYGAAFKSLARLVIGATLAMALCAPAVHAQDCTSLLPMFRAGRNITEIARVTGLSTHEVASCRQELSGAAGAPPFGAAGAAPRRRVGPAPSGNTAGGAPMGAAGSPAMGAAGPPPMGAAGPPPIGAAGPPPIGAAGSPLVGRDGRRLP